MQIGDIIKLIADKLNEDKDLVDKICNIPFKFTVEVMKDPNDKHPILFNKLFKISLKPRFKNE